MPPNYNCNGSTRFGGVGQETSILIDTLNHFILIQHTFLYRVYLYEVPHESYCQEVPLADWVYGPESFCVTCPLLPNLVLT